ncbi:cupredoxin domain-containing protein [Cohnella thailandensis]|jgi:hypothetical protein|uniref:Cupredoxin domain-containing protein n=1 Tax=Cohnella thailandensis TaxID=557557 RepID=A0A841TB76_9BACL|nr:cupredoxin domain-containing protein [Cohnella thailandensis]MBB6638481.1 cupredoxin domain-containing protein [Cohnella thailandensis]MBP1977459.1 plastocyanin [Cohnella thailandensis]
MSKVVFISKKRAQWYLVLALVVIIAGVYIGWQQNKPAMATLDDSGTQVFNLVTGEFTSTVNGKQLEAYVFAPSTIPVKKGVPVELRITGVSGQSHPFVIEGLDIEGTVQKGKTTVVNFTPKEAGTYSIVCTTHSDPQTSIPMVGYLVVQ